MSTIAIQVLIEGNQLILDFADDTTAKSWSRRLGGKRKILLLSPQGLCLLALGKDERIAFRIDMDNGNSLFPLYLFAPPTRYLIRGTTFAAGGQLDRCEWHSRMPAAGQYSERTGAMPDNARGEECLNC